MFKVLFNRGGWVVRLLEVIGLVNSFFVLQRQGFELNGVTGLYLFLLLCNLLVRVCDWIHWYPGEPRWVGIEVHFRKARVPSSYILAIVSLICLSPFQTSSIVLLVLADLMMLVVVSVNGIQIYFHLHDRDPLPINYFSLNKYLQDADRGFPL